MVIDLLTTVFQHAVQSIELRSYFIVLPHKFLPNSTITLNNNDDDDDDGYDTQTYVSLV